ncbi:photosynthetic reaction center subunit H [Altererythrobacter lutimaris]|uniref:Photosynthetic reaction center subunit H n=1 Tax=Altererythrobacter lutimaris TaxID=2743979 RepID=A0A850HHZ2_9SPHN|nr:photosynthetic reaction center subunit H [Altererythrobacter lutimaris]NVE94962.1 photosynthetic reaction center subunit H [Altererythrobacter lutimaris]
MDNGNFVGTVDVAELALLLFFLFFFALIVWIRREDRREGYPLEEENGKLLPDGGPLGKAPTKTFILPNGKGTYSVPNANDRDPVDIAAKQREPFNGSPYIPTGNPLTDGIGPAGYAQRAKWPDQDAHGHNRLGPLSATDKISIAPLSKDPRGLPVIAADGKTAGTVSDLWVDHAEHVIRYFEVDTGSVKVLAPFNMARIWGGRVLLDAINAEDYAGVPQLSTPGEITRDEEERIMAYFGGGYLYANRDRQEPFI